MLPIRSKSCENEKIGKHPEKNIKFKTFYR